VAAGAALVLLGGCGNSRTPAPTIGAPAVPAGFRVVDVPTAGATLSVPQNWTLLGTHSSSLLVLDTSGNAVIALWRYPVRGSDPQDAPQLQLARQRLIASSRAHDRSLRVISSGVARVGGEPAITLEADEHIGTSERRVFSTHVFEGREELVLEEYAPAQSFATVDATVFSPVRSSLTLAPR
jgi:hypothetical protein